MLQTAPGPLSGPEGIRGLFPISRAQAYQELQAKQVEINALTQRVNQLTPVRHWCLLSARAEGTLPGSAAHHEDQQSLCMSTTTCHGRVGHLAFRVHGCAFLCGCRQAMRVFLCHMNADDCECRVTMAPTAWMGALDPQVHSLLLQNGPDGAHSDCASGECQSATDACGQVLQDRPGTQAWDQQGQPGVLVR